MGQFGFSKAFSLAFILLLTSGMSPGAPSASGAVNHAATARPSIGKLICSKGSRTVASTATMVLDRKTLLGVSHFNRLADGTEIAPEKCRFITTAVDSSGAAVTSSSQISIRQVGGDAFQNQVSRATDWVILNLEGPVPAELKPIAIRDRASVSTAEVFMAGFTLERGSKVVWRTDFNCSLQSAGPRSALLNHDCLSGPGASGSPLLAARGSRLEIIGMHVGRTDHGGLAVQVSRIVPKTWASTEPEARPARQVALAGAVGVIPGSQ